MQIFSLILIIIASFCIGFGVRGLINSEVPAEQTAFDTYDSPPPITMDSVRSAYRKGVLFGQSWAYSSCSEQAAAKDHWLQQGTYASFDGYRVENGKFKTPDK